MVEETKDKVDKTNPVAVIKQFEETLDLAIKGEQKKIPKWSVDVITKMKDKHIGSLQSQIRYLKQNKRAEFFDLYKEEIAKLCKEYDLKFEELNSESYDSIENFKLELLELIKIKLAKSDLLESVKKKDLTDDLLRVSERGIFENPESLQLHNVSFVRGLNRYDFFNIENLCSQHNCQRIVGLFFDLNYNDFFENAKSQIKKLERLFEESLAFNDLVTTHGVYQELKKADVLLDSVSKVKIEKVDIDFKKYLASQEEEEKLKKEIQSKQKYEFVEN